MLETRILPEKLKTQWAQSITDMTKLMNSDDMADLVDKFLFCEQSEQKECLENISNKFFEKIGYKLDTLNIFRDEENSLRGGYFSIEKNLIFLNFDTEKKSSVEKKLEILIFLFHESRHAYQNKLMEEGPTPENEDFVNAIYHSQINYVSAETSATKKMKSEEDIKRDDLNAVRYLTNISEQDANFFSYAITKDLIKNIHDKKANSKDFEDKLYYYDNFLNIVKDKEDDYLSSLSFSMDKIEEVNKENSESLDLAMEIMSDSLQLPKEIRSNYQEDYKELLKTQKSILSLCGDEGLLNKRIKEKLSTVSKDVIFENIDNPFVEEIVNSTRPTITLANNGERSQENDLSSINLKDLADFMKGGTAVLDFLNIKTSTSMKNIKIFNMIKENSPKALVRIVNDVNMRAGLQRKLSKGEKLTETDQKNIQYLTEKYKIDKTSDKSSTLKQSLSEKIPSDIGKDIFVFCFENAKSNEPDSILSRNDLLSELSKGTDKRALMQYQENLLEAGVENHPIEKLYDHGPSYLDKFKRIKKEPEEYNDLYKQIKPLFAPRKKHDTLADFVEDFEEVYENFAIDMLTKTKLSNKDISTFSKIVSLHAEEFIDNDALQKKILDLPESKRENFCNLMNKYDKAKKENNMIEILSSMDPRYVMMQNITKNKDFVNSVEKMNDRAK